MGELSSPSDDDLHCLLRRVVFQPYTRQQLETIAKTRLEGLDIFEGRAIEYAARKVPLLPLHPSAQ